MGMSLFHTILCSRFTTFFIGPLLAGAIRFRPTTPIVAGQKMAPYCPGKTQLNYVHQLDFLLFATESTVNCSRFCAADLRHYLLSYKKTPYAVGFLRCLAVAAYFFSELSASMVQRQIANKKKIDFLGYTGYTAACIQGSAIDLLDTAILGDIDTGYWIPSQAMQMCPLTNFTNFGLDTIFRSSILCSIFTTI